MPPLDACYSPPSSSHDTCACFVDVSRWFVLYPTAVIETRHLGLGGQTLSHCQAKACGRTLPLHSRRASPYTWSVPQSGWRKGLTCPLHPLHQMARQQGKLLGGRVNVEGITRHEVQVRYLYHPAILRSACYHSSPYQGHL